MSQALSNAFAQEGLDIADAKGLAKLDSQIESLRAEKKAISSELGEIGSRMKPGFLSFFCCLRFVVMEAQSWCSGIASLNNALTNDQIEKEILKLKEEVCCT